MRKQKQNHAVSAAAAPSMPNAIAPDPTVFRERSQEVSRIEGFSDAVFGFAVTLMVVSLEVPRNYAELSEAMRGFFAFAACFASLFLIWYYQHKFFRRYGLQDGITLLLNAILLFVVLFYVYPLKFLFTLLFNQMLGDRTAFLTAFEGITGQVTRLMVIYGLGYLAVFSIFALLHVHALRRRAELGLNAIEVFDTKGSFQYHCISVAVALLSILIAVSPLPNAPFYSGITYGLLGPAFALFGSFNGRRRRALEARVFAAE